MKKDFLGKNYEDGGLKMININTVITSMKLFSIRHLISTNRGLHNFIPNFIEDRFISCGIEYVKYFSEPLKQQILDRCVQSMG